MFASLKDKVSDAIRVKMSKSEYVQLFAEVCSDEKWGPTVPDMDKLVAVYPSGYYDILPEMQLRFDNRKENWRRCYKSLLILDHFCRTLEARFLDDLKSFMPTLKELSTSFFHTDDKGVDRGVSVRERAKKVIELLTDSALLAAEREKTDKARQATGGVGGDSAKYQGFGSNGTGGGIGGGGGSSSSSAASGGAGRFGGFSGGDYGGSSGGGGGASGGDYGGVSSDGRYSGHGSSDTSPAAVEAARSRGISQESADLELARKMQEEEDKRARANHVPTSAEVMRDHEIAKRMAGDAPQTVPGGGGHHSHHSHNHHHSSSTATRVSGPIITSATVITSSGGGPSHKIDLFSSGGGGGGAGKTSGGGGGTSLDDIFGSSSSNSKPAPNNNNNNSHDPFGAPVGAPKATNNNNNNDDIFGAPVAPPSQTSAAASSDPFGAFMSSSSSSSSQQKPAASSGIGVGGSAGGVDPFASLSALGTAGSSSSGATAPKPTSSSYHHSSAQASAVTADIFGAPSPAKPPQSKAGDFPF